MEAPRTIALGYFALGPPRPTRRPEPSATTTVSPAITPSGSRLQRRGRDPLLVDAFAATGADELILFPTSADPAQVDLLARRPSADHLRPHNDHPGEHAVDGPSD
ncbi:MAG TPA: hypothetical protein VIU11_14580 [Nakamurella sp.]